MESTTYGEVHCVGGVNDFDFHYHLDEGTRLELPAFVGLYSNEGFGGVSRSWHAYDREHVLPEPPEAVRPVLYNSWEATAFAVTERNQMELAEKAAELGAEVFVVDDGWYAGREHDYSGLGDWTVDPGKFPHGLNPLITRVNALGMRFGLWVEPEMVNPDSKLYRAHPDWVCDALDRLRIQEGFSYVYAPRVMMCWVTDCPNYLTKRTVPLSYRFHVAMSGSLGIGGDISRWTPQELEAARGFIARYKQVRSTIQNGLLYRLRSPRKGHVAAVQYVARNSSEIVVFVWGHSQQFGETQVSLALRALKRDAQYTDTISGTTYSGAYLTYQGLQVNLLGDFDSHMIHLVVAEPIR